MKIRMTNASVKTFCGFYETLYNDESRGNYLEVKEIIESQAREKKGVSGPYYTLVDRDFNEYTRRVAEKHLEVTESMVEYAQKDAGYEGMISNLKLFKVHSPTYYNYMTDWLEFDVDFKEELLEKFCFQEHKKEFQKFLEDVNFRESLVYVDMWSAFRGKCNNWSNEANVVKFVYEYSKGRYQTCDYMVEFALNYLVDFGYVEECVYESIEELSDFVLEKYENGNYVQYELEYGDDDMYHAGELIEGKIA